MNEDVLKSLEQSYDALSEIFRLQLLLLDGSSESLALSASRERILRKQNEIQREKERIARIRTLDTHRKELEKKRRERDLASKRGKQEPIRGGH